MKRILGFLLLGFTVCLTGCFEQVKWGTFEYMAVMEDQKLEGLEVTLPDGTVIKLKGKSTEANTVDTLNALKDVINIAK